jgi:nucleotide-binding universal stress UspA family protein
MKILLAVDGSPHTRKALDYLAAHRDMFVDGHELVVVHVCAGVPGHVARHLPKALIADYYTEESAKVIAPVEQALRQHGITAFRIERRHGRTAQEILKAAAESGAELILIGAHGHGLFGQTLLGSVATKVMSATDIPVLVVR